MLLFMVSLISLLATGIGVDVPTKSCAVPDSCTIQPQTYTSYIDRVTTLDISKDDICLLKQLSGDCVISSILQVHEAYAVPDSQGWSRCQYCGLDSQGNILLYNSSRTSSEGISETINNSADPGITIDVAWSLWGEFFHADNNDQHKALDNANSSENTRQFIINRPVYVIPVITLHVGHILIDIIEQIYQSMMTHYGEVRRDALLIIDVAGLEERQVLQEKLFTSVEGGSLSDIGSIIHALTRLPVFTTKLLKELGNMGVVFKDVHVGLDISKSHFNKGHLYQPCLIQLHHSIEIMRVAKAYRSFKIYLEEFHSKNVIGGIDMKSSAGFSSGVIEMLESNRIKALVVQRKSSRIIKNVDHLTNLLDAMNIGWLICILETIPYATQRYLFSKIDVLILTAGTAAHNLLFMKPGSTVVLLMQPNWCEWSWMYANQAILLGIKPYVYCSFKTFEEPSDGNMIIPYKYSQWSSRMWLQGPRMTKSDNITVDLSMMQTLLLKAASGIDSQANQLNASSIEDRMNTLGLSHSYLTIESRKLIAELGVAIDDDISVCPGTTVGAMNNQGMNDNITKSEDSTDRIGVVQGLKVFVNDILTTRMPEGSWKVTIDCEVGGPTPHFASIFESLPHLAVCMRVVPPNFINNSDTSPGCYSIKAFNYYSNIEVYLDYPVEAFHIWLQLSQHGGKLRGSDNIFAVDARLPNGGLYSVKQNSGAQLLFPLEVYDCIDSDNNNNYQLLRVPMDYPVDPEIAYCLIAKPLFFEHRLSSTRYLQAAIVSFCGNHGLNTVLCGTFVLKFFRFLWQLTTANELKLPKPLTLPSSEEPFIFLHVEKSGGTTLRDFIVDSADKRELQYVIPCMNVHCTLTALPSHINSSCPEFNRLIKEEIGGSNPDFTKSESDLIKSEGVRGDPEMLPSPRYFDLSNVSVLAGHFSWNVWKSLPKYSDKLVNTNGCPLASNEADAQKVVAKVEVNPAIPSCIVVGRDPVDRFISYYYQRCYQNDCAIGKGRLINSLSVAELEELIISLRYASRRGRGSKEIVIVDDGVSDAACRMLTDTKVTTGMVAGIDELLLPDPLDSAATTKALRNVDKCVVSILERWQESKAVISHWFPWIDLHVKENRQLYKSSVRKEKKADLRKELVKVILDYNRCDAALYHHMNDLFEKQLQVLRVDNFQ